IQQYRTIRYDIAPLSPHSKLRLSRVKRKILVLDLDETLIHSQHDGLVQLGTQSRPPFDFSVQVRIERHNVRFFVRKRPHVDFFLDVVSQWFDLVIFTASLQIYGEAVSQRLDNGRKMFSRGYYRQDCQVDNGGFTKSLSSISPDLSSVFILDNSPGAYRLFPDNAIPISSWFSDSSDTALLALLPVLDSLRFVNDVRSVLGRNLHRS
uniref:FCP1 homology domain-containing protein n=2 Tax=Macrostomum lignano TaxID=282301 RepID=A0A1I8I6R9_9PLAT